MSLLPLAIETLIDALRDEVTEHTVLVARDDLYEVKRTPCLILQGPKLEEHAERRSFDPLVRKNLPDATAHIQAHPQLYHCDFEVLLTCAKQEELTTLQTKLLAFVQRTPWLVVDETVKFALVEITPLGGFMKPNLSNLRQVAGVYRLEDVPVFGTPPTEVKLTKTVIFEIRDQDTTSVEPLAIVEVTEADL